MLPQTVNRIRVAITDSSIVLDYSVSSFRFQAHVGICETFNERENGRRWIKRRKMEGVQDFIHYISKYIREMQQNPLG